MKFEELKIILKRLFKEYVKKHFKRIIIALILSLIVAGSTSGIAWLLDPAIEKSKFTLIQLIDQIRMLDQDMIRLQKKLDTVLEMKENERKKPK